MEQCLEMLELAVSFIESDYETRKESGQDFNEGEKEGFMTIVSYMARNKKAPSPYTIKMYHQFEEDLK